MIDRVRFDVRGTGRIIRPWEDYGILMVSHQTPPPPVRTHKVKIDGRDGELDLSEWAGRVIYEERTVSIVLRDLWGHMDTLIDALHGRAVGITFSDDPEHYFEGRCEISDRETRRRVTDIEMTCTCSPYRYKHESSVVTLPLDGTTEKTLRAEHMETTALITPDFSTGFLMLTVNGTLHTIPSSEYTKPNWEPRWLIIKQQPMTVKGYRATNVDGTGVISGDASLTFKWRDGVI